MDDLALVTLGDVETSLTEDNDGMDRPTRSSSPDTSSDGARGAAALVKRPWTPEEDVALIAAVHKYGACRWSMIATQLSTGRVGKQCRERWNNHLCPEVKKSEWSEEEDRAILQGVAVMGTRWCEIIKAPALSGRTDNAIKNRFYSLQRRMKARQAGGHRSSRRASGACDSGDEEEEATAPGQTDRIMAIATELAFATDEGERDRLIEMLTTTLHEHETSTLGDGDNSLAQFEGFSSCLDSSAAPHVQMAPPRSPLTLSAGELDLVPSGSAVADLLQLPLSPQRDDGCSAKQRLPSTLADAYVADAFIAESAGFPDMTVPDLTDAASSEASTISPDGAGGVATLCPSAWPLPDGQCRADAEQTEQCTGAPSELIDATAANTHCTKMLIDATCANGETSSELATTAGKTLVDKTHVCSNILVDHAHQPSSPSSLKRPLLTDSASPVTPDGPFVRMIESAENVSAACLGGRHAYKAFLAPLQLPTEQTDEVDSPKRMRTPHGAAVPPSSRRSGSPGLASSHVAIASRVGGGGAGGVRTASWNSAATRPAALQLSTFVEMGQPVTQCTVTGTEEPGAVRQVAVGALPTSPMTELLSFSVFTDLFSEAHPDAEATPTSATSTNSTPSSVGRTHALTPTAPGGASPVAAAVLAKVACTEPSKAKAARRVSDGGVRGTRRSARQCGEPAEKQITVGAALV
eukprot:CAMPEP_0174694828 /NCGR_PEP_ID=MMETSP1094-20130205/1330_1 /TAXON_ID=156173 /ORGANISM="Chrysochromulina brevifilum, Strain UTEX LB 985" /LENGTH=693 /DNA_ID=CAMNT_0015891169 /DNA_START=70 /DNA_END=2151 /DNA_ORIENTATION=+